MSEAAMWKAIRPVLKSLHPVRIENSVSSGVPDVNYSHGWIENKYRKEWPKRGGPVTVPHFTSNQRAWHMARKRAGGLSFILLKVGRSEWLLFDGAKAAAFLGPSTRQTLYEVCLARWERLPKLEELKKWLTPQ